ncbi:flagellin, partial [Mobiluncus curtisii]|nr:flagellin [Mobiluncus curtisii]
GAMTTLIVDGYSVAMSAGMSAAGFSAPGSDDCTEPFSDDDTEMPSFGTTRCAETSRSLRKTSGAGDAAEDAGDPAADVVPDSESARSDEPGTRLAAVKSGAFSRYAVLTPLGGAPRSR